jgi:hypothetical protein
VIKFDAGFRIKTKVKLALDSSAIYNLYTFKWLHKILENSTFVRIFLQLRIQNSLVFPCVKLLLNKTFRHFLRLNRSKLTACRSKGRHHGSFQYREVSHGPPRLWPGLSASGTGWHRLVWRRPHLAQLVRPPVSLTVRSQVFPGLRFRSLLNQLLFLVDISCLYVSI